MNIKLSVNTIIVFLLLLNFSIVHAVTLQNNVIFNANPLPKLNITPFDFTIPDDADKVTISLTNGSGDLDLFLKYGSPITGNTIEEIASNSDAYTESTSADEQIILNSSSNPSLKSGQWYAAVLNWNDYATAYDILVSVEASSSQTSSTPASASTGSGGIPVGAVISNNNELSVIAMNISNEFAMEDVQSIQSTIIPLIAQLGAGGTVIPVKAEDLIAAGLNGSQLHNALVAILSDMKTYYQVNVNKVNNSLGSLIRVDVYLWDNEHSGGEFMTAFEVSEAPPLTELMGISTGGTRYIKVKTTESVTAVGNKMARMEFYFQETTSSAGLFLATIEITELLTKSGFALFDSESGNSDILSDLPAETAELAQTAASAVQFADPMPLMELFSLMAVGTRYLKIDTVQVGEESIRMSLSFQETAGSVSLPVLTISL